MDTDEYKERGKEMVDYIAEYLRNIRSRRVYPNVKPGYLQELIPQFAPVDAESWENIFSDIERCIMPGITHWQSPHMHAYFPALNSFPSLLGDMLADAINCLGFTWASSPAATELEIIVMNWLGKMIGLPDEFLQINGSSLGGGVIQTTASESTLVCLLAGRTETIIRYKTVDDSMNDAEMNGRLVAYCSDQAHSSVEKACLIGLVKLRYIESDDSYSLRVDKLSEAISHDKTKGLIPFFVCATLGTTSACAFDNLEKIGEVCAKHKLWIHVDAAYAGSSFVCPEYRKWLKGVKYADSFSFNPSKWLMVNFDCTALWVKNCGSLHRTFNVEPLYLKHENSGHAIDYMGVTAAQKFETLVTNDMRFTLPATRHLGLIVFALRTGNHFTERLLKTLNSRGAIHCVPATLKVTSQYTTEEDIIKDWNEIQLCTDIIFNQYQEVSDRATAVAKIENFGTSLLLSNTPMSPKVVNGSFAAIFDKQDALSPWKQWVTQLYNETIKSPTMKICNRDIFKHGKQYSVNSQVNVTHKMFLKSSAISDVTALKCPSSEESDDTEI